MLFIMHSPLMVWAYRQRWRISNLRADFWLWRVRLKIRMKRQLGIRSPSRDYIQATQKAVDGFYDGFDSGIDKPFSEFAPEVWSQLKRSANTLTWGDDE